MNVDEIVRATRSLAVSRDNQCDNDFVLMAGKKVVLNIAADLIESLQAQLAEQKGASYWKSAWETQCNENKLLYESLAESQRRERTAVDMCDGCNFKNTVGCHCARAAWRGPQEAGDE